MDVLNRNKGSSNVDNSFVLRPDKDDLLTLHNQYFESKAANTCSLLEIAHTLRYQVYCLERKFEDPNGHTDGRESDVYDDRAIHGVLFHRPTDCAIGTVRMIMPKGREVDTLPVMALLRKSSIDLAHHVQIERTVEISRFAISKEYRRRQREDLAAANGSPSNRRESIRQGSLACLSLLQFLIRQSAESGVLYWTAVMEPKLLRMFASFGMRLTSIGSLVMHHGLRQPCYCYIPSMLEGVLQTHPEYWQVLTDGGALDVQRANQSARAFSPYQLGNIFEAAE